MNHLFNEEQFSAGFLPAWFEIRRRHALEQAERLPEPSRRMESWRFGTPGNESLEHAEAALPVAPEALSPIIREHASMPRPSALFTPTGSPCPSRKSFRKGFP